jgi:hypothetical protein
MSLWGRADQAVIANSTTTTQTTNGEPQFAYNLVHGTQVNQVAGANAHYGNTSPGSFANTNTNLFGNDTPSAFITNMATGIFGVTATEMANNVNNSLADRPQHAGWVIRRAGTGGIATATANSTGTSGFVANESIIIGNGSSNAVLLAVTNSQGNLASLTVANPGSGWNNTAITSTTFVREQYVSAITVTAPKYIATVPITGANSGYTVNSYLIFTASNSATQFVVGQSAPLVINSSGYVNAIVVANGGYFSSTLVAANIVITVANVGGGAIQGNSSATCFGVTLASAAANGYVNGSIISYSTTTSVPYAGVINAVSAALVTNSTGGNTTTVAVTNKGLFSNTAIPANLTVTVTLPAGNTTANTLPWPFVPTMINSTGGAVILTLGGRAGRVHTETIVAMGSLGAQSAAYGTPAAVNGAFVNSVYYSGA